MAPGSNKRKRPERGFSQDDISGRPSPHRPENMGLAQPAQNGFRGGRHGTGSRGQSRQGPQSPPSAHAAPGTPRAAPTPSTPQLQPALSVGTPVPDASRANTPVQRTAASAQQRVPDESRAPSVAYVYDYLTDETLAAWPDGGKESVLESVRTADEMALSTVLQELVRSSLDGRLDPVEAGLVIKHMLSESGNTSDAQSLFIDIISLLDDSDLKNAAFRSLVAATDIDPDVLRQELDIPLLQALSLVRNSFVQMRTRKTTNILYRQANFNLLREESEGYAKLLTEYFNTAQEVSSHRDADADMAEDAFLRVKALVGAFDLDIGRVLDITMDISANLLVKAYGFFMKFYRCSSWWPDSEVLDNIKWEDQGFSAFPAWALPGSGRTTPSDEERRQLTSLKQTRDTLFWERVQGVGMDAFFEIGSRRIVDYDSVSALLATEIQPQLDARGKEVNEDKRKRINENRKYMRETRSLPSPGNSDAAQLLGFKLRFYASSARDAQDTLPENLMALAALLIKIGFISLRDLYPHLYPPDEKMPEEKKRLEKEKSEKEAKDRPGAGLNALAMAAALPDDTVPAVRNLRSEKERSGDTTPKTDVKEEEPQEQLPPPENQKIMLLRNLLLIGALPEALYILGRFPWLADVDVSIPPYLHRIARQMLSGMAETVRPLADREGLEESRDQLADTVPGPDGEMSLTSRPTRKPVRWLGLDKIDEKDGIEYKFYYADWADNIPLCQTVDDVFSLCNTFIGYLGVKIGQDPEILGTLVRIAKRDLHDDASDSNRAKWLGLMKRLLVPALSLSKHNPGLTQEVCDLLRLYPMTTRYNVYAEWFIGKTSRLPDIQIAFAHNRAEVKDVLRRVTNDNAKKQARALAKVAYSSPGIVTMYMIGQLESYSNMIRALVECTRFFPMLGHDVLTWSLINSLSGQGRDRMQADGMLTSPWLQALSHFVASLFARYSSVNPSPVLQYLASELRTGNSTDLEMFEQVLVEMAGIRPDLQFSDTQVQSMAGGDHLQSIVLQLLGDTRHTKKNTAKRLIKALAEPGLVGQLLIAIAQERQMYQHHDSSKYMPLKVLGNNVDKIQQILAQYLEVLRANLKPEEFEASVPDAVSLISDFGLEAGVAFTICRAAIAYRVAEFDEAKKLEELQEKRRRLSNDRAHANGDIEMQGAGSKASVNGDLVAKNESPFNNQGLDTDVNGIPNKITTLSRSHGATTDNDSPWHPVLQPIINRLSEATDLADRISLPFFVTFWTLSQGDIAVFTESYHHEMEKLSKQVTQLSSERGDSSGTDPKERERKKKSLQEQWDSLRLEVKGCVAVYSKNAKRLSDREKYHWFPKPSNRDEFDSMHVALLQECFLPRAMQSSLDAHFSFIMLKLLHEKGTPNFSTMNFLSQLFRKHELAALIFQCTQMESQHLGRFLNETLKMLAKWHADKPVYDKEAVGSANKTRLPGFAKPFDVADGAPDSFLDFETFRRLLTNWHSALNGAMQMCFESGEYSHIRNGIMVLKSVVQVFPAINFMGQILLKHITKLSQEEKREDLKLMATSLIGPLKGREKKWVMPQAFRLNDLAKDGKTIKLETPQPGSGTPKLSATAPEFKPAVTPNETGRKASIAGGPEDGEVEDERDANKKRDDTEMKDAPPVRDVSQNDGAIAAKSEATTPAEVIPTSSETTKDARTSEAIAASPAPTPAVPTSQPTANGTEPADSDVVSSAQPGSSRDQHGLPSRPERQDARVPPPSGKPLHVPPPQAGRHFNRREDGYGRLDRTAAGEYRPGSREHSPGRSRPHTPPVSSRVVPPRDEWPTSRAARDDAYTNPRRDAPGPGQQGRHNTLPNDRDRPNGVTESSAGPPAAHSDKSGFLNSVITAPSLPPMSRPPSVAAQSSQPPSDELSFHENPGRLAQMTSNRERREREPRDLRVPAAHHQRPETRPPGRLQGSEIFREQARADLPNDLASNAPRPGRLSRDMGPPPMQQESTYGRLNGPPEGQLGPRAPPNGPAVRGGRNFTAPTPFSNRPIEPSAPPQSTNRPFESPASFRGQATADRQGPSPQVERQQSSTAPSTGQAGEGAPMGAMHPSRMAQFGPKPPPIQTNVAGSVGPPSVPSPSSGPPSGPRSSNRPLAGAHPGPLTNGPPSGPATPAERARRNDRQRNIATAINATLQGVNGGPESSGRDVSFRGASSRQGSVSVPSSAVMPTVHAIASPIEPPMRRQDMMPRPDGPPSRPSSRAEPRPDLFARTHDMTNGEGGPPRRRDEEFSDRPRGGPNAGRDYRPNEEAPRRQPGPPIDDGSQKREALHEGRRIRDDRDGPPREHRDADRAPRPDEGLMRRGPPEMNYPNMRPEWERGNAGRGMGPRLGPPDDSRRGGRHGMGRGEDFERERRREDERARGVAGPPWEEGGPEGRKRRHDDGPQFDGMKRRRGGR